MSFNIIDKNPRKPRVEGKKAQEQYVESLMHDWVDNHSVHEANAREDRHPKMTWNERARMLEEGEKHIAQLREKGYFGPTKDTLEVAGDGPPDAVVQAAKRGELLVKKLAYQESAYGCCHIEDLDELRECSRICQEYHD